MPNINRLFALALHYKRQIKGLIDQKVTDSTVLFIDKRSLNTGLNNRSNNFSAQHLFPQRKFNGTNLGKQPTCSFYGIYGHLVEKCFKKYGYPLVIELLLKTIIDLQIELRAISFHMKVML